MHRIFLLILTSFLQTYLLAQADTSLLQNSPAIKQELQETYTIKKTAFSSDKYNEFSPAYYKDKLVFCTDQNKGVSDYSTAENARFFNIYAADTAEAFRSGKVRPFAKELNSKLNDGPVSFNSTGDTIYFSRNLMVDGKLTKLSSSLNKLGIFSASLENGHWKRVTEFRHNNEWYHVTTPCLSPDGKRMYFASDRLDGQGGSDIWYSDWKAGYWDTPVNLGPVINSSGNEAYPFMNPAGELFFSSDGHPGMGGKDIFVSKHVDKEWLKPVALDAPINSEHEDFGFVSNRLLDEGYFSSKRGKTLDIYYFKSNFPQIFFPGSLRRKQY